MLLFNLWYFTTCVVIFCIAIFPVAIVLLYHICCCIFCVAVLSCCIFLLLYHLWCCIFCVAVFSVLLYFLPLFFVLLYHLYCCITCVAGLSCYIFCVAVSPVMLYYLCCCSLLANSSCSCEIWDFCFSLVAFVSSSSRDSAAALIWASWDFFCCKQKIRLRHRIVLKFFIKAKLDTKSTLIYDNLMKSMGNQPLILKMSKMES